MSDGRAACSVEQAVMQAWSREELGRLLATLVRRFGDLDLAEEVASEAVALALERRPVDGVPARPGAWLLTTARHRAVDLLRRDRTYGARLAVLRMEAERAGPVVMEEGRTSPTSGCGCSSPVAIPRCPSKRRPR